MSFPRLDHKCISKFVRVHAPGHGYQAEYGRMVDDALERG